MLWRRARQRMRGSHMGETQQVEAVEPMARTLSVLSALGIGAAAAIVGLVPWVITGMRLPLQNLWETDARPDGLPIVMLPFSQYAIALLVGLLVTGAALAGLLARILRPRLTPRGTLGIVLGVLAVQVSAGIQTALVVANGLRDGTASQLYLSALVGVTVVAIGAGMAVLLLIARAPRAGATIAFAVAAIAVGSWLNGLILPLGSTPDGSAFALLAMARWVPAVLVGIAIAWCGVRTVGRALAIAASLLILWVVPAAITAGTAAAGSRVFGDRLGDMIEYGSQVFATALLTSEVSFAPVVVAAVIGALGLLLGMLTSRPQVSG